MATDIGKAYVQIIPSAKGIKGGIEKSMGGEMQSAGSSLGKTLVGTLKKVIVAAGIGKAIISTVKEGAALEQSLGGVETLFKNSADKVKKHAAEAYKTVGIGANDYMENVTSFSASLLQSLGGDTEKAAKVSNMAMIDMGDNANKMGTNMRDIQNAYQGFAKQNYTMLDNLKLGYGGTKTEMERLLADAEKLTGVKYDINNLSDVYEAIHAIQGNLGITGTTALEASETVSGSFNAMLAAAKNLQGAIAGQLDLGPSLQAMADTIATFLFGNLIPMVWNIVKALPPALIGFIKAFLPRLLQAGQDFINFLAQGITVGIPNLLAKGAEIVQNIGQGIVQGFPAFQANFVALFSTIGEFISSHAPAFLSKGAEIIGKIAMGILQAIPTAVGGLMDLFSALFSFIGENFPKIMENGKNLIVKLCEGIKDKIPTVLQTIGKLLLDVLTKIVEKLPDFLKNGIEMVKRIAVGIIQNLPEVITAIGRVLLKIIAEIVKNLPTILAKGVELIGKLAAGILQAIPTAVSAAAGVLGAIISKIGSYVGQMLSKGVELIGSLARGIGNGLGAAASAAGRVLGGIVRAFTGGVGQLVSAGRNLILGLARGIGNAVGAAIGAARRAASRVVGAVKGAFKIHSPSKVFEEIGEYLNLGLAEGITGSLRPVSRAMDLMEEETTRDFSTNFLGTAKGAITAGVGDIVAGQKEQPMYLNLSMGGHVFKTFAEDITRVQDKQTNLELEY
ncbi:hypothetical protein WKS98_03415 [Lagierella sp. ICN-221743]